MHTHTLYPGLQWDHSRPPCSLGSAGPEGGYTEGTGGEQAHTTSGEKSWCISPTERGYQYFYAKTLEEKEIICSSLLFLSTLDARQCIITRVHNNSKDFSRKKRQFDGQETCQFLFLYNSLSLSLSSSFPSPAQNSQWYSEHAGDWQQKQDAAPDWRQRYILAVTCCLSGQ